MKKVAIIDYRAGNLRSISQAFRKLNAKPIVTDRQEAIESADYVVLPGDGSFPCIKNLSVIIKTIVSSIRNKPFLGVCLGMQALFEGSEEAENEGLSIFKGRVRKLRGKVKIPHIGWNKIDIAKEGRLFEGIQKNSYFYFMHSYAPEPVDKRIVATTTEYGQVFTSAIEKENIFATQFHPEKSGENGLKLLRNFLAL